MNHSSPLQIVWSAQTHQGRVRMNNEDAFLSLRFGREEMSFLGKEGYSPIELHDFIFAVSDGMGGGNAGEFASRIVLETITELVSREFQQRIHEQGNPEELLAGFCQRIHERARYVSQYYTECKGMGATLSLGWIRRDRICIAHLGDSRIYHLPLDGEIRQLTHDHTIPGRLYREGKISEREARSHPRKNELERSIGALPDPVDPQIVMTSFRRGDRFVLCSDGITDGLWDRNVDRFVRDPPPYLVDLSPAERLVREALDASGRDNLTAMVLEICEDSCKVGSR